MPETYKNFLLTPEDKRDLRVVRSFIDLAFESFETGDQA